MYSKQRGDFKKRIRRQVNDGTRANRNKSPNQKKKDQQKGELTLRPLDKQ